MIGKIMAIAVLLLKTADGFYKAGKYANGGKEITEGHYAALKSIVEALFFASVAAQLYLN